MLSAGATPPVAGSRQRIQVERLSMQSLCAYFLATPGPVRKKLVPSVKLPGEGSCSLLDIGPSINVLIQLQVTGGRIWVLGLA